jgi:predicted ABC-type ATPase
MAEHLNKNRPTCYVIAGPNGAGKTTFAMHYLPRVAKVAEFVNADAIAHGLSPLNEQAVQLEAGRIFLRRIDEMIQRGRDFAFETTLSGRAYIRLFGCLRERGFRVVLFYLWIPSPAFSAARVASRVASGGHDIPSDAIERRYPKSLSNLFYLYIPLAHRTLIFDNSGERATLVAEIASDLTRIANHELYSLIMRQVQETETDEQD